MRPICKTQGCHNPAKKGALSKSGSQLYVKLCSQCSKSKHAQGKWQNRNHRVYNKPKQYNNYNKLPYCECCGFIAVNRCQLDVDHIDGNHENNDHNNLQTLCANCHRLKTWLNKDYKK